MKLYSDKRGGLTVADKYDKVLVATNLKKYTIRGLHYQTDPEQVKIIQVSQGSILDFVYNVRTEQVIFTLLNSSSEPFKVGKGWAHGYLTLEDNTVVTYGVTGEYNESTYTVYPWTDIKPIMLRIVEIVMSSSITISDKDNGL